MNRLLSGIIRFLEINTDITIAKPEQRVFLGKSYRVLPGTIRSAPDYDDAWLFTLARNAKCVFDVGCNIGQSSFLMMCASNSSQMVLIDPNPLALSKAAHNLILNNLSERARFVCAFASDAVDDQIDFFTVGSGAAGSMYSGHARSASKKKSHYAVRTLTLDSLSSALGVIPDLVKIDTEGAEFLVLSGSEQIAARQSAFFFVEMHSQPELSMAENAAKIIAWCERARYKPWYLKDKIELLRPDQIAARGRCHLVLLPAAQPFPSELYQIEQGASITDTIIVSCDQN